MGIYVLPLICFCRLQLTSCRCANTRSGLAKPKARMRRSAQRAAIRRESLLQLEYYFFPQITPQTPAQFTASECFDLIDLKATKLDLDQLGDFFCDHCH